MDRWCVCAGLALSACGCDSTEGNTVPMNVGASEASIDAALEVSASEDSLVEPGQDASSEPWAQDASKDTGTEVESPEAGGDATIDTGPVPTTCSFNYGFPAVLPPTPSLAAAHGKPAFLSADTAIARIAHHDPPPPGTHLIPKPGVHPGPPDIVMPSYSDDMPLFERAQEWSTPTRCYETPLGAKQMSEAEAYDLYNKAAEATTGLTPTTADGVRTVVGIRGAYPGTFAWHGNAPNLFNDTLVLLWQSGGTKHVREFPVNTDTGAHDFGADSSSSLRPNRRYYYVNGWHKTYNALHIDEDGYRVRDDHNTNGHWDSDRNGWLPPLGSEDHDRAGGGHNIHMGSMDGPLNAALVDSWSAGCQVIPGASNWKEFITNAWTNEGDKVNYFLLDARDIAQEVWTPCTPDGTHACPYRIDAIPFSDSKDTSAVSTSQFNQYNCSAADESGSEVVYVMTVDKSGTLAVSVDCAAPVDVDIHLLEGDDNNACLARNDTNFTYALAPGRYFIVVDTYAKNGTPLPGPYTLTVSWQ